MPENIRTLNNKMKLKLLIIGFLGSVSAYVGYKSYESYCTIKKLYRYILGLNNKIEDSSLEFLKGKYCFVTGKANHASNYSENGEKGRTLLKYLSYVDLGSFRYFA